VPAVRYLDLIVLALALPVFVVAGWPLLGYAAGAVAWLAQRAIQAWTNAQAVQAQEDGNVKRVAGYVTGSMIGRGWLVALIIFGAGMVENDAARYGLHFGNTFRKQGLKELAQMAYFDLEAKMFRWI